MASTEEAHVVHVNDQEPVILAEVCQLDWGDGETVLPSHPWSGGTYGLQGPRREWDRVCRDIRDGREQTLPSQGRIQMTKTNYLQIAMS